LILRSNAMPMPLNSARVAELFAYRGRTLKATPDMSQTDHALQCATRAENAGEGPDLVIAALLHDIGYVLAAPANNQAALLDDALSPFDTETGLPKRECAEAKRAVRQMTLSALQGWLPNESVATVRLLGAAKHYLCAVENDYWDALTPASQAELLADGGPYDAALVARFRQYPCHAAAVRLRRYDDQAKRNDMAARPLDYFIDCLERYERRILAIHVIEPVPTAPVRNGLAPIPTRAMSEPAAKAYLLSPARLWEPGAAA
jgi:predicted HD phosphohydrolase